MDSKDIKDELRRKVVELGEQALDRISRRDRPETPPEELTTDPVFTSSVSPTAAGKVKTLVIVCSGGRFLHQYEDFLGKSLSVTDYDLIAVPGGVQWFALADVLPKHHKVARWMAEFLIEKHRLDRVICIAHQDCGAYQDSEGLASLSRLVSGKDLQQHQLEHLRTAAQSLSQWSNAAVELYFASVENDRVVFRKVE